MSPRLNLRAASRSLCARTRPSIGHLHPRFTNTISHRGFADEKTPPVGGPNESGLGHVSEEAADMGSITGDTQPDLGQGTPVQEILERDEESKEKAPEVIKEEIDGPKKDAASAMSTPEGLGEAESTSFANLLALGQMENIASGGTGDDPVDIQKVGLKFEAVPKPYPANYNKKNRYDPIVDQVTNLLMKDGKKSAAQRNMSFILNQLRTAPPPTPNPSRPLLPGHPPPHSLPLNPIGYLALAVDSVAPLLRMRSQKGGAGGGVALQVPVPLGLRQRRNVAMKWILDAASKKRSRGSGRGMFAQRVADEIIAVVEGKSNAWEKRLLVHKTGTTARSNVGAGKRKKRIV